MGKKEKKLNGNLIKACEAAPFPILDHTILLGYCGSIAHGTYYRKSEIDDRDVMGVFVLPLRRYFGLSYVVGAPRKKVAEDCLEEYRKFEGEWDIVCYSIGKFVRLLLRNNPNVVSLLWLPEYHYLKKTREGQLLIDNRDIFTSKLAYESFCGYAYGQLHRMTHGAHKGYMGEKRKALVEKFGFDCANASHLVRLLKMGIEFLTTGELVVERPESSLLIEIKRGLWKLEDVKKMAEALFGKMELAFINSKLKDKPDHGQANNLLIDIVCSFHGLEHHGKA